MNTDIKKTGQAKHLQLRTKRYLQKTSSSIYWNINNYRTVFCSNYWNM